MRTSLTSALRRIVLPKFGAAGFGTVEWWDAIRQDGGFGKQHPFGQLRKAVAAGTQLVEIQTGKYGSEFTISAGTVPCTGIMGPDGPIHADRVLSTWLDEWVSAYAWPRYFVPFKPDRFWRRVRTQGDVDRYVAGCAGVVAEIVAFLDHGIVGRHLRHSVIDRGYGPVPDGDAR